MTKKEKKTTKVPVFNTEAVCRCPQSGIKKVIPLEHFSKFFIQYLQHEFVKIAI